MKELRQESENAKGEFFFSLDLREAFPDLYRVVIELRTQLEELYKNPSTRKLSLVIFQIIQKNIVEFLETLKEQEEPGLLKLSELVEPKSIKGAKAMIESIVVSPEHSDILKRIAILIADNIGKFPPSYGDTGPVINVGKTLMYRYKGILTLLLNEISTGKSLTVETLLERTGLSSERSVQQALGKLKRIFRSIQGIPFLLIGNSKSGFRLERKE